MTKDWPNKADLASYFAYWRRRVASRGVRAKRRRALRGGPRRKASRASYAARSQPAFPREGAGGMMRITIAPRHSAQKGDAGFPEPILHGVRMEEPCVSCLSQYLETERHVFCACRCRLSAFLRRTGAVWPRFCALPFRRASFRPTRAVLFD